MKDIIVILVALISIGFAAWGTVVEGNWMKDQIKKNKYNNHSRLSFFKKDTLIYVFYFLYFF